MRSASTQVVTEQRHLAGVPAADDDVSGRAVEFVADAGDDSRAAGVVVERNLFLVGRAIERNVAGLRTGLVVE